MTVQNEIGPGGAPTPFAPGLTDWKESAVSNAICSIEGCGRPHIARGWCDSHYRRWRRSGDVRPDAPFQEQYATPAESFAARTMRSGACLVWTGEKDRAGYGRMHASGRTTYAHRWAWEQAHGPIPAGMLIDHVCWNPACVKLEHLRLASFAENNRYRQGAESGTATGVRNVYKVRKKFTVKIGFNGQSLFFGAHSTLEEAARVAAEKRAELFGDFAGGG